MADSHLVQEEAVINGSSLWGKSLPVCWKPSCKHSNLLLFAGAMQASVRQAGRGPKATMSNRHIQKDEGLSVWWDGRLIQAAGARVGSQGWGRSGLGVGQKARAAGRQLARPGRGTLGHVASGMAPLSSLCFRLHPKSRAVAFGPHTALLSGVSKQPSVFLLDE